MDGKLNNIPFNVGRMLEVNHDSHPNSAGEIYEDQLKRQKVHNRTFMERELAVEVGRDAANAKDQNAYNNYKNKLTKPLKDVFGSYNMYKTFIDEEIANQVALMQAQGKTK